MLLTKDCFIIWGGAFILWVAVIPIIEFLIWNNEFTINSNLKAFWISTTVIYPCFGFFLEHIVDINHFNWKRILLLWCISIAAIFICCVLEYCQYNRINEHTEVFHNMFNLIHASVIYLTIKFIMIKNNVMGKMTGVINHFAEHTFGIYLIHYAILRKWNGINYLWDLLLVKVKMNHMLSAFVICIFVFLTSYLIVSIMKKIPILKLLV